MSNRTAEFVEVLRDAVTAGLRGLHKAMPGIVESYDPATQTADVKPQVKELIIDEDGNEALYELPVIPKVPVAHPRGGGYFVAFPLARGDQVLLVISDRSLDRWKTDGGDVDPGDPRQHDLADAIAYPGGYPIGSALADADADDLVIGRDGTGPLITLKDDGSIDLGRAVSEFVALATKVVTELDKHKTVFDAHTHPAPGGTTSPTATPFLSASSVAASTVKAE